MIRDALNLPAPPRAEAVHVRFTCSLCEATVSYPTPVAIQYARALGWRLLTGRAHCPRCSARTTP